MKRLLSLLLLTPVLVWAESQTDYAYVAPITASAGTPFQRIALPSPVYGTLTHGDMRDLRVFNATGEVVPHAFEPRPATQLDSVAMREVPLFPLPHSTTTGGGIAVQVERRGDGTVVNVRESAERGMASPDAWLLDASQLKQGVRALELVPADAKAQFAGRMRVEGSDDLEHWRVLARSAPLLVAHAGAQSLARLRIEWPATEAKYWRLSWADGAAHGVAFGSARFEPAQVASEPARIWQRIEPIRVNAGESEYIYALPPGAPADRLRIHLSQNNTVVPVTVLARAGNERDWRIIGSHVAYRLVQSNGEFENPDLPVNASQQLMLRFDTRGGGLGSGTPMLEIGWVPHTLVFAARGSGPFVLAYGNAQARTAAYPIASLVPGYSEREVEATRELIGNATLGVPAQSGGDARLRPQTDFRRWILWSVLGIAVVLLGTMAYRLWRQMGSGTTSDKPPR